MHLLPLLKSKQPQFGLGHIPMGVEAAEAKNSSTLNRGHLVKIILELNFTADKMINCNISSASTASKWPQTASEILLFSL